MSVGQESIPATRRLRYYDSRLQGLENRALDWLLASRPEYRGRIFGRNGEQKGPKLCYELYIEIHPNESADSPGTPGDDADQPAVTGLFAQTTCPNTEDKINAAWDYLYLTWLAGSMFERSGQPYFEEYLFKNGRPAKLRLYLPLQKRADAANITLETDPALRFAVAAAKTEKAAAGAVMEFLRERHPHMVQGASEFYLQQDAKGFICGVAVDDSVTEHTLTPGPGHYLVLHSAVMGEYDALCGRLLAFAGGNGMQARREDCFAVYDARGGYENLGMKVYCGVKLTRDDNTEPAGCAIIGLSDR